MNNWLLQNGTFMISDQLQQGHLFVSQGKIKRFYSDAFSSAEIELDLNGVRYEKMDCTGAVIGPGFIDIHVHGGGGAEVMDASIRSFEQMAVTHGQRGTTRFLLTTITAPHEDLVAVSKASREWLEEIDGQLQRNEVGQEHSLHRGALPLGIHLEGPYINEGKKGAQNADYIRPFSMEEFNQYQQESGHAIQLITLAPEKLLDMESISSLTEQGVVVSIGHTEATYEEVDRAFGHGARHITHLCNAMPGIHHRSPGPITYALTTEGLTVEMITDGIHVHPAVIQMVLAAKKLDEIAVVTDAIKATDKGEGTFGLGKMAVTVKDGKATLADGTLAGSCLHMEQAYQFLKESVHADEVQLFQMMSATPAKILGVDDRLGRLEEGYEADLVIFRDDEITDVMAAGNWIKGGVQG